jgi:regulatory protein YycH of two-component signal transduction system YycFG
MELTYEKVKSIILTVLVVTSVILTWSLWSFQPNVEELGNKSDTVKEVTLSNKKDIKDIVSIDQIIFNIEGNYYGTGFDKIDDLMSEISDWDFNTFYPVAPDQLDITSIADNNDSVQIMYPGEIPSELFASIYQLEGKEIPKFQFDRILIDFESFDYEYGNVYFISQDNKEVYLSHVSAVFFNEFRNAYFTEATQYNQYFPYPTSTGRKIYLPKDETKLAKNQYTINKLPVVKLKNALFSDPSIVERSIIDFGEEYTDGHNIMLVNNDNYTITYIDFSAENQDINTGGLLQKSVDFVNNHGGWTDDYRYVGLDKRRKTVNFRIYGPNGYPVFGETSSISKIEIEWASSGISSYRRNNFSLEQLTVNPVQTLESGYEALDKIRERDHFNENLLQDLTIGYRMTMNGKILSLEPSWFYLYNGNWESLMMNTGGGEQVGLEQD